MKKTFALQQPGKADARVVEAVKNEIRKYVKRERRKEVPEGFDTWDFACRVGADEAQAVTELLKDVTPAIDKLVGSGAKAVFVEILASPGHRQFGTDTPPPAT